MLPLLGQTGESAGLGVRVWAPAERPLPFWNTRRAGPCLHWPWFWSLVASPWFPAPVGACHEAAQPSRASTEIQRPLLCWTPGPREATSVCARLLLRALGRLKSLPVAGQGLTVAPLLCRSTAVTWPPTRPVTHQVLNSLIHSFMKAISSLSHSLKTFTHSLICSRPPPSHVRAPEPSRGVCKEGLKDQRSSGWPSRARSKCLEWTRSFPDPRSAQPSLSLWCLLGGSLDSPRSCGVSKAQMWPPE